MHRLVPSFVVLCALNPSIATAADVILNEYNAVAPDEWIGNPDLDECEGPMGFGCSSKEDTFFGRIIGNGGNWFELFVITDHVDMRGWSLFWEEVNNLKVGTIFLSEDMLWSDLRAGTIITFTELTTAEGGLDTDTSFDPCNGDWWINVNSFDTTYVPETTTNVRGDGSGNFTTGNNDWRLTILNSSDAVIYGPAGEGSLDYSGTSVNNREICRLQEDPSDSTLPSGPYDDGTRSNFGSFNNWTNEFSCRTYQTLDALRDEFVATECKMCQRIVLNEYNAVADDLFLNGGDAKMDSDGGLASDVFFGRVLANGGDWFELVVIEDHLDMRNWSMTWESVDSGASGTVVLSSDSFWSDIRSGAILTFVEWTSAQGGLDTDTSFDPGAGDRWININTFDTTYVSMTTSNIKGHISGQFDVDADDWRLTIVDELGTPVFGPAGEGSIFYYQDKVSNQNIFRLEESPSFSTTPLSPYDDGASASFFGAGNQWTLCPSGDIQQQDFSALPDCPFVDATTTTPDEFNAFRGFLDSGTLADVLASDDNDLCHDLGITIFPSEAPITLDFDGTLPNDSPASLDVTIESSANTPGLELTILFWNYNTNSWDIVGTAAQGFNVDVVRTFAGVPADHVEPGTGNVRTRYEVRQAGIIFQFPWTDCIDHVFWTTT